MINKIKIQLGLLIIGLYVFPLNAQTNYDDTYVQEQYWRFRERFRKFHVYVGFQDGRSIPIIDIKPGESVGLQEFNSSNQLIGNPESKFGLISMGDATIDLGNYLALLDGSFTITFELQHPFENPYIFIE